MGSIPALVQPAVMKWARESIGLTPVAAARKMGLPDDRVSQWETGEKPPTIAQLKKATKVYNRPLAVFYLAEPPTTFDTLRDFRRIADAEAGEWSPALHAEYRRALHQREQFMDLLELDETEPATHWRIDLFPGGDESLAAAARENLVALAPLAFPLNSSSQYAHLNFWTAALEEAGVLVMASAGGRVKTSEMRAFSLYYEDVPVIMTNGADRVRGRVFSLLHEYAHLVLHTGGLCDTVADRRATSPNRKLEARCNGIAASILMPPEMVLARSEVRARVNNQQSWTYEALRSAATPFGASAEAFLRRLATLGRVDMNYYLQRRKEFLAAYEEEESRARTKGGDWYRNTVRDLGKGYVRRVADAHKRRIIDSYTAASYLDVKVGQIERLAEKASISQGVA